MTPNAELIAEARAHAAWLRGHQTFHPTLDAAEAFDSLATALSRAEADRDALLKASSDSVGPVDFYEREFYPLSNFSAFHLRWRGLDFDTSEAAYHWEKFAFGVADSIADMVLIADSAHEAFKIAEANRDARRHDWDDVKVGIMREIIRAKADQHEYVRRKLLETGDRLLIEGSWRDDFWGIGPNGDGQNMLGKLWMGLRSDFHALASACKAAGGGG